MAIIKHERSQCLVRNALARVSLISAAALISAGDIAIANDRFQNRNAVLTQELRDLQGELKKIQSKMDAISQKLKAEHRIKASENPRQTQSISSKIVSLKSRIEAQRLYDKAYSSYLDNDFIAAEQKFSEFLRLYPNDRLTVSAQVWLAEVYNKRGEHEKAARLFEQAHELQSKRGEPVTSNIASAVLPKKLSLDSLYKSREKPIAHRFDRNLSAIDQDNLYDDVKAGTSQDFAVNVGDRIFFETDSYELTDHAFNILGSQVEWFQEYPKILITVEGHADERGTREYNLALGAARANAVKKYLIEEGIDSKRIRTISYGKERPVALCDNISCWAQNRRAVTTLEEDRSSSGRAKVIDYSLRQPSRDIWNGSEKRVKVQYDSGSHQYMDLALPGPGYPVAQR